MAKSVRSDPRYSRKTKAQLVEELKRLERQVCDSNPLAAEYTKSPAKLRENEQLFKVVFDGTIDSIFVIDPDGERIVDANASACRMLQYSRKDLLKLSISDIHPHEMEKMRQLAQEVFSRGKARSDQLSCLTRSGGHIPVEVTASRVNMQGRPFMLVVAREIGERMRREQELQKKSAVLQVILDTMDQGISVVDANLNGIASNAKFLELLEFPPELGADAPFEAYIRYNAERGEYGPGDIEELVRERVELAKQFKPHRFERVRPDGTVIEIRGNPSADGGFVTTYTDITEHKRAEEAVRQSIERYRSLYNDTPVMMHSIDAKGRLVSISNYWLRTLGYERDEVVGKRATDFLTKESREFALKKSLPAFFKTGQAKNVPYQFVKKNGETVDVLLSAICERDADGNIFRSLAVLVDITERKRAEARFREAVESVSEGIALYDADDRLVLCNSKYREIYAESADMIVPGTRFEDILRAGLARGQYAEAIGRENRWLTERLHSHRNCSGAIEQQLSNGRWLLTEERQTREGGTVGIRTDITEIKQREEELRAAKEQAELANRSKSEFLANMSHELRTPLNAVIGFSEMMRQEMFGPLGNDQYKQYAKDIYDSGNDLLDLINDILDLSKIEAGKFVLYEEPLNVTKAIESCLRIVKERAKENGLRLTTRLAKDLPMLEADARALKQITLNLLSNAIKFTPHGGRITVRARLDSDGGFVLAVADTGIGIAAKDVETAFAPFGQVQVDVVLNRAHRGTGLGLPMVKSLVALHGGNVDLKSKVGVGTTVTACFPAERVRQIPYEPGVEASAAQR